MRGSLNSAFEDCKAIDQIFHQEASDVEKKLKELQVRVGNLMVVIVHHVTLDDQEGTKEIAVKTVEGIEQDIEELLRCGLLRIGSLTASDDITAFLSQSMRI